MNNFDMYDILCSLEGTIGPVADEYTDSFSINNLEAWEDLFIKMFNEFISCANTELRYAESSRVISNMCRELLMDVKSTIDNESKNWSDNNESN